MTKKTSKKKLSSREASDWIYLPVIKEKEVNGRSRFKIPRDWFKNKIREQLREIIHEYEEERRAYK